MSEIKRFKPVINDKPYKPYAHCEESEDGIYVSLSDYDKLKSERDALAAENLVIKSFIEDECYTLGDGWMYDAIQAMPQTPATDAYANQLRAEGVEMFAKDFNCADISADILEFAAQLRAGEPS